MIIAFSIQVNASSFFHPDTLVSVKNEKKFVSEKKATRLSKREARKLQISLKSMNQFNTEFSSKAINWTKGAFFDIATYMNEDGKISHAYYDQDANLSGITSVASYDDIPARAQKFISKHYSTYDVQKVIYFDDCSDKLDSDSEYYGSPLQGEKRHIVYLNNGTKQILLQVSKSGDVYRFK